MPLELPSYIAGQPVKSEQKLNVHYPYDGTLVGTVTCAQAADLERALAIGAGKHESLTRFQRAEILRNTRSLLEQRKTEIADLIRMETGLCQQDTLYEVGRTMDVLDFAAMEALRDDGQIFSCDLTHHGKARKIFTQREPVQLIASITPFNHPLNQVAHKVSPAVACGAPMILKPSDKTPLTAVRFVEMLYEAGLPQSLLSVLVGDVDEVITPLICDDRVEMVAFTGSVSIGKHIAGIAGYKKLCLELGGNSPLIILDDADLEQAVKLAAEGSFRNSGQRCTAVKRLLVHEAILQPFTERFVALAREYTSGDPADPTTRVGTVIDEASAQRLHRVVQEAVADGAEILLGGDYKSGALYPPTVIGNVQRHSTMVVEESFGPLAPIMAIRDIDDAIELANSTAFGLSTGIVTNNMTLAIKAIKGIRTGTVNVNEVPGFRIESSPFGGIKDSGLGIKEGVIDAMKFMTNTKTFSLPW
ncbi:MAG: putative phosphonoacetaldehyde dehydrogenase [Verrucomicrobiales bacterium]|jgi:putative phosphonoacetaldehyde dehydrogenase